MAPRVAGVVELRATLAWRSPEEVPDLPTLTHPVSGDARISLVESDDPQAATRRIAGDVRSLTGAGLGAGLEALLREIAAFAALTEATLEARATRTVPPRAARAWELERLARDVWEAGYPVRFAPSWTPSAGADAYLGVGGSEDLSAYLRAHPSWYPA